jgi:hypothetical protein
MTNDEETQKEEYTPLNIDPLLQTVVSLVNKTGLGIPVTLSVKGMFISGDIIKRDEYYDRLIAVLGDPAVGMKVGNDKEISKIIAEHFSSMLNLFKDFGNKPDESGEEILPTLIHLANVQIMDTTGRPVPYFGALWRGKMDSVDGYIFGKPEIM